MHHGTRLAQVRGETPLGLDWDRFRGGYGGASTRISCLDMITDDLIYSPAPGGGEGVGVLWRWCSWCCG